MRVGVIVPVAVRHDAISEAARSTVRMLSAQPGRDVTLFAAAHDPDGSTVRMTPGPMELMMDPAFRQADVLIYHFGIYHPLIDTLPFGNARARRIVRFHNITPAALLGPGSQQVIARSFRQLHLLDTADAIWADSTENAAVLERLGIGRGRIAVLPLAVDWPPPGELAAKPHDSVEALYVGRIVPSKGLRDLIEHWPAEGELRLTVVGNVTFSDPEYLAQCRAMIVDRGLAARILLLGTVDQDQLAALYRTSHILALPSYHEGFCKPVIEGLRAGCVPIGYAAAAVPETSGGLAQLVPPGDAAGLCRALHRMAADLRTGAPLGLSAGRMSVAAFDSAAQAHVARFGAAGLAQETIARVDALAS